jgi:hypothetical protein
MHMMLFTLNPSSYVVGSFHVSVLGITSSSDGKSGPDIPLLMISVSDGVPQKLAGRIP